MDRESQLLEWRLTLTEERNAVMVPSAGSGIPGAPAEWWATWQNWLLALKPRLTSFILCAVCLFTGSLCQAWRRTFLSSSSTLNVHPLIFRLKYGFPVCRLISFFSFAADDLSSQDQFEVPEAGGWDAILNGEDEDDFFDLQIVKHYDSEVRAGPGRLESFCRRMNSVHCRNSRNKWIFVGESRSLVGLHHPRVPPAESWRDVARAAGLFDS